MLEKLKKWLNWDADLTVQERFQGAVARLSVVLQDADRDGLPDSMQQIARNVTQAVQALEVLMPRLPIGKKRGAERLLEFKRAFTKVTIDYERDWRVIGPLIEAAVALLKRDPK
jgi:hypothetical protein